MIWGTIMLVRNERTNWKPATMAAETPITLLVKQFDRIDTMKIDYHGGLQYPVLERIAGRPDRLAELWKAR